MRETIVTVTGATTGDGWWPRMRLFKSVSRSFHLPDRGGDRLTMRDIVDKLLLDEGRDYATAAMLTADTVIAVEHIERGRHAARTISRWYGAVELPSIGDMVSDYTGPDDLAF